MGLASVVPELEGEEEADGVMEPVGVGELEARESRQSIEEERQLFPRRGLREIPRSPVVAGTASPQTFVM